MDITETIIKIATGQLGKRLGGCAPLVMKFHKTHFILLARAVNESNRDQEIQKTLREMRKNLEYWTKEGKKLFSLIPSRPKPPVADGAVWVNRSTAEAYLRKCKVYHNGVKMIIEALQKFSSKTNDMLTKSEVKLKQIEKILTMKGTKLTGMRAMSIHYRTTEIIGLRLHELSTLSKQRSKAETLIHRYKNW